MAEDAELIRFPVGEPPFRLELALRRWGPEGGDSVLLLHGANTRGRTFLEPEGGFVRYLVERGRQAWVLEWRGSPEIVASLPRGGWLGGSPIEEIRHYTVDDVAREDIPAALEVIRARIGETARLSVLGHCVGGGALAIAIAMGRLERLGVGRIVLSTLGLFYEVPWAGWIKAEDFVLERVLHSDPECCGIAPVRSPAPDPRAWPWPRDVERAYGGFPGAWLPPDGGRGELFRRLAFMIGQPYAPERLHPSLRDGRLTDPIFGPLHVGLYLHVCQMARRGYAAPLDAPDVIDRTRLGRARRADPAPLDYLKPGPFRRIETTLLCAGENEVWHRDSVDLMHEWLRNHGAPSAKRVFRRHDIQELFWGDGAEREVYPVILEAL